MVTSYDYSILYKVFSRLLKNELTLTMIDLNGNGRPPEPPFVAFDIINPKIPNNYLEDDRVFETVISFTIYSKNKLEAMNLCNQVRATLRTTSADVIYAKNGISLVETMAIEPRFVTETNNYAYMYGFDARLRLVEVESTPDIEITDIKIKEN